MSRVHAVIFDIDGTLLLSNNAHARAFIEAAETLGIKADFAKVRHLIGKGGDKLIPEAFGFEEDSALGKELDELKGQVFKTRYLSRLQPSPGPLLSRLHEEGIRLAVALQEYAAHRGFTSVEEYRDEGISGSKDSRPALDKLMKDAKARKLMLLLLRDLIGSPGV